MVTGMGLEKGEGSMTGPQWHNPRAGCFAPRTSPISAPPFAKERVSLWALLKWRK